MAPCKTCVICSLLISACGTLPDGRGYGQYVTPWPGWARIGTAAKAAATDLRTWAPLAGAAAVMATRVDDDVSEWAVEQNFVFGSPKRADEWSDRLRDVTRASAVISLLATPGGNDAAEVTVARFKSLAVQSVAVAGNAQMSNAIKRSVGRERPNGGNDRSFPSGHSSESFVQAAFARYHLNVIDAAPPVLQTGVDAVVAGVAWSRVEAGVHYPSDVLAGAALGNFIAKFFYGAFYGDSETTGALLPVLSRDRIAIAATLRF